MTIVVFLEFLEMSMKVQKIQCPQTFNELHWLNPIDVNTTFSLFHLFLNRGNKHVFITSNDNKIAFATKTDY